MFNVIEEVSTSSEPTKARCSNKNKNVFMLAIQMKIRGKIQMKRKEVSGRIYMKITVTELVLELTLKRGQRQLQ